MRRPKDAGEESAGIFEAHQLMLEDEDLQDSTKRSSQSRREAQSTQSRLHLTTMRRCSLRWMILT